MFIEEEKGDIKLISQFRGLQFRWLVIPLIDYLCKSW